MNYWASWTHTQGILRFSCIRMSRRKPHLLTNEVHFSIKLCHFFQKSECDISARGHKNFWSPSKRNYKGSHWWYDGQVTKSWAKLGTSWKGVQITKKYTMKLNPSKYCFGVLFVKFLGYLMTQKGIEANLEQMQAILNIRSPAKEKVVQKLIGRISTLNRFIFKSPERSSHVSANLENQIISSGLPSVKKHYSSWKSSSLILEIHK